MSGPHSVLWWTGSTSVTIPLSLQNTFGCLPVIKKYQTIQYSKYLYFQYSAHPQRPCPRPSPGTRPQDPETSAAWRGGQPPAAISGTWQLDNKHWSAAASGNTFWERQGAVRKVNVLQYVLYIHRGKAQTVFNVCSIFFIE